MYEDAGPRTSSSKFAEGGRALLSRLSSPLKRSSRNVADFHIRPTEPHRQYSPGDIVKGIVVLTVVKAVRVTHLTVALHGFVRVLKSPATAGETITSEPAIPIVNSRRSQYTGNGHASLFNDEITLCGEGRLEPGIYEFEFNLQFPSRGLPTSIDFERGTISYLIRSTLTRPTSIGPTTICERKISLIESVDIGPMQPPSSRLISLEPIPRRSRKHIKSSTKLQDALDTEKNEATASPNVRQNGDSPTTDESRSQPGSRHGTARSVRSRSFASVDLQSEISEDSAASTSSTGYIIGQTIESQRDSRRESVDVPPTPAGPRKTITAKIELGKSGCLPGDSIPITISIQHTKRIKSLHGIIITLYRQGRIDSSPPLSMFTDITGKDLERLKHEEYYPRSKTGLGGLSLTSPASSGVFRKDLSQTLAPIMIDPTTLSTEVTASVRVPEDVFPTVTGVPGEMISFKYYVEVVIDLGGKLAGQDRHLPRLGMVSLPSMTNPNGTTLGRDPGVAPTLAAWGGNIVNTDRIRREKSVVASLFEVVVGSTDSARQRGRGTTISRLTTLTKVAPSQTQNDERRLESSNGHYHNQHDGGYNDEGDYRDHRNQRASLGYGGYENEDQEWNINNGHDGRYQYNQRPHDIPEDYREHQVPDYAENSEPPPPEITPEEEMTEKDRVRLAEQRLLPSAPPPDDAASPAPRDDDQGPSAPPDPDKYGVSAYSDHPHQQNEAGPSTRPPPPSHRSTQQSARRAHNVIPPSSPSSSSAPSVPPTSSPLPPTDDKAELARRRLQAEASSPADLPHDGGDDAPSAPPLEHVSTTPPAPHVEEEDLYADDSRQPRHLFPSPGEHREELPEYQR